MAPRPFSRPSGSLILRIVLVVISAFVIGSAGTPTRPSADYRRLSRLLKRLETSPVTNPLIKLPSTRYNASDCSSLSSIAAVDRLSELSPPSNSSSPRDSRIPFQTSRSAKDANQRRRLQVLQPSGRRAGKYSLGNPINLSKLKLVRFAPLASLASSSDVSVPAGSVSCKGKPCPDLSPCPGFAGKVATCWNPADPVDPDADLAAYGRTILLNRTQSRIHFSTGVNPLDQCLEDDGTQPGHLLRPSCPPDDDPGPITLSLRTADLRAAQEQAQREAQARRRLKWGKAAKKAPEPAGALFVLNDVFLDGEGRVFNATHRFDVSGCATSSSQTVYGVDTHVSRQETVLNLLLPGHFMERRPLYDQILMVLPPLLPLHHVLPSLRRAKVVTHAKKLLQLLISQLLGLPLAKHSFLSTTDGTPSSKYLWHVQTLYQPVIPHCTNPDLPLWKHFRRRFLLPTPPLPDPTADSTTPTPTLSSSSSSRSLTEENPSSALSDPSSPLERVPKVPPGFLDGARSVFPSLPALPVEGYAQGGDLHGSWVPIGWQVVVAHDSMRCTKALGQVEELLHRYFPADRIVVFSSSRKIMEGKHIFNRAALFITCLGLAITNTMFMPPRAAVLDLRPPIPVSHTTRYTLLSRSFASANDVRSFVLICQPGGDNDDVAAGSGQLECNTREIDDVIDRIAHDIYTSPAAVAAAMSPTRDAEAAAEALADAEASGRSLLRPTDLIRGSVLRGPLQVQKFRSWMKCVGQEGRWVYDPKPRRLPWWFMGKPYQCDSPMSGRHHGKSLGEADEIADARGDPEEWTVRETLKYKWGVPANACPKVPVRSWEVEEEETEGGRRYRGREARAVESGGDGRETMRMTMRFSHSSWMKFSPEKFCERVGRGRLFLFLGDSLNEQLSEAFLNNLVLSLPKPVSEEHLRMEIPRYCSDWHNDSSVRHAFCKFYSVSDDVCPGLRAAYVRTDQLTLSNPRLFDRQPWSRMEVIREADVIIINRGPHYEEDELYAPVLERALMYLRSRFPEKLIIWRNTPPGHANCSGQKTPLKKRQDPGILPYNWDKFARQNKLAEVIVKRYGAAYMDVDSMTALRADGHKEFVPAVNKVDCLHYCHPGPLDGWVEHLYNTLSWLMAPPPVDA